MILDSSAVVAVLFDEPDRAWVQQHLGQADTVGIGSPTLVETAIVLVARLGVSGRTLLARFVEEGELEIVSCTRQHSDIAIDAFLRFGKGRHPAKLNFGDCLTYAVAYLAGEPLLCVGEDFRQTDLPLVAR